MKFGATLPNGAKPVSTQRTEPEVENEQPPYERTAITTAALMLYGDPANRRRVHEFQDRRIVAVQAIDSMVQFTSKPAAERNAETLLRTLEHGMRNDVFDGSAQDPLARSVTHSQM